MLFSMLGSFCHQWIWSGVSARFDRNCIAVSVERRVMTVNGTKEPVRVFSTCTRNYQVWHIVSEEVASSLNSSSAVLRMVRAKLPPLPPPFVPLHPGKAVDAQQRTKDDDEHEDEHEHDWGRHGGSPSSILLLSSSLSCSCSCSILDGAREGRGRGRARARARLGKAWGSPSSILLLSCSLSCSCSCSIFDGAREWTTRAISASPWQWVFRSIYDSGRMLYG
jgi:hypothetical protein